MNFKRLLKPILVILAILILTLSVSAGDLFGTYDKRIKITIDHTKIDADLSWFPVTVFLGNYGDAIDVGTEAIDGDFYFVPSTCISKSNPANASGKITSVEIYAYENMTGVIVATFYRPDPTGQPNYLVARDNYEIGSVTAGSKQTFTVELDVEAGDYLGIYFSAGSIERISSGDDIWRLSDNHTETTGESFNLHSGLDIALYATGFTINGAEVFDEFDADEDFDRIAFTSSDGETQLYADCELFDVSESKAIYHVSKTGWTVSSSTDTDIYLYYDKDAPHNTTYISKSGGTAAQSVWDSNFKAVYHMNDPDVTYDTEYDGSALPTASTPAWNYTDGASQSEATYSSVSEGILTFDTTGVADAFPRYFLYPDVDFDAGVYLRIRLHIHSDTPTDGYLAIFINDGTQNERTFFYIGDGLIRHRTSGGSYTNYSKTTSDDYHIYEFYVKGTSSKFYMDGVLLGEETVESATVGGSIQFGDSSAASGLNIKCYIDYFNYALDIGYNPVGIIDATSNANHGTKYGSIEATGKVGQGQDFDGSDDYVSIGTSAIGLTDNITVEAIGNIDTDINGRLITKHKTGNYGWLLARSSTDNNLEWRISTNGSDWNGGNSNTNTFNTTTDYYFVGTYDGSQMKVFIDGIEETAGDFPVSLSGNINDSSQDLQIGTDQHSGTNFFDGIIDEVRISSTARSAAWIGATYDSLWDTLLTYGSEETAPPASDTNVLFIFSNF